MRKVACSQVTTLSDEELDMVVGGGSRAESIQKGICRALSGRAKACNGCGSSAKKYHRAGRGSSSSNHSSGGGCGASARGASGHGSRK